MNPPSTVPPRFEMSPIGYVRSGLKQRSGAPRQGWEGAPDATLDAYRDRLGDNLFPSIALPEAVVLPLWAELEKGPRPIATLAQAANLTPDFALMVIATLAKMGLVRMRPQQIP